MPLPQTFSRATLMVNGQRYELTNVVIQDHEVTMERDAVMGSGGRVRGFTRGRQTERVTLSAEVGESVGIDSRDATLASAYAAPLRVTPTQAGLSMPEGTFSSEPPSEPITLAMVEAASRSIQRHVDRVMDSVATATWGGGSSELESDAAVRERLAAQRDGRPVWGGVSLDTATGADLDVLAAIYGVTREPVKASLKQEHPMLVFKEAATPEPLKTALDMILEDEGEAA